MSRRPHHEATGPRTLARINSVVAGSLLVVALSGCGGSTVQESQEIIEQLEVPEGYRLIADAEEPVHSATEQDYVFRQFEAPQGVDICSDMQDAFEQWADTPVRRYDNLNGCEVVTGEPGGVQRRMSAAPDESRRFTVSMYVRKDDWF